MKYYFAYGANMDLDAMFVRCPYVKFIEVGELKGYRFIINTRGVASFVPDITSSVYGIIWSITKEDEASLDYFEGIQKGWYSKHTFEVEEIANKNILDCLVYVSSDSKEGTPIKDYFANIIKWANNYHFPQDYVDYLQSHRFVIKVFKEKNEF
jgi:gamma-glutamylcyclotransferase (GGCT)/AIG2-like uncharacterized protein YtfP